MARKGKRNAKASAGPVPPTKYSAAEVAAYRRGFADGRRAEIKREQERGAPRGPLLRLPEVLRRYPISRATIWREEREGRFPLRVQITENTVGWYESELEAWAANRPRQEDKDWLDTLSPEDRERARRGELALFRIYAPPAAKRRPPRRDA